MPGVSVEDQTVINPALKAHTSIAMNYRTAPAAPKYRLAWAWARGVLDRLEMARARREAIYGQPELALVRVFGQRAARLMMLTSVLHDRMRSRDDRLAGYRAIVCLHIAPGGWWRMPDDPLGAVEHGAEHGTEHGTSDTRGGMWRP